MTGRDMVRCDISRPDFYRLGLIGYPLGHSRSPELHLAALAAAGLAGEYRLYAIPPDDVGRAEIAQKVADLRAGCLHGLNVTIPHKQTVMPLVDRLSPVAGAVGAANTLYRDVDGLVAGDNTDVPAFLRNVQRLLSVESHQTGSWAGSALVLGAGGSARAVVYGLGQAGWQVRALARRVEQAAGLVAEISAAIGQGARLSAGELSPANLQAASAGCDLLVNTTPLGMFPKVEGCPWPEDLPLPEGAAVYDLIYNPLETVLLRRARTEGLSADNGLGMLADQGALAFARWTGLEPPFAVMEQVFSLSY